MVGGERADKANPHFPKLALASVWRTDWEGDGVGERKMS